jgi:hypothetical protein
MVGADIPQPASVGAWLLCLACLSPAVWRIARRRARSLDPIWGVVFLLAVNRLSFLFHVERWYRMGRLFYWRSQWPS